MISRDSSSCCFFVLSSPLSMSVSGGVEASQPADDQPSVENREKRVNSRAQLAQIFSLSYTSDMNEQIFERTMTTRMDGGHNKHSYILFAPLVSLFGCGWLEKKNIWHLDTCTQWTEAANEWQIGSFCSHSSIDGWDEMRLIIAKQSMKTPNLRLGRLLQPAAVFGPPPSSSARQC